VFRRTEERRLVRLLRLRFAFTLLAFRLRPTRRFAFFFWSRPWPDTIG
jgi:hypothetical protein